MLRETGLFLVQSHRHPFEAVGATDWKCSRTANMVGLCLAC